jgi:hypothetical protein
MGMHHLTQKPDTERWKQAEDLFQDVPREDEPGTVDSKLQRKPEFDFYNAIVNFFEFK